MNYPACPKCKGENTYSYDDNMICPDCNFEWNPSEIVEIETTSTSPLEVKDANGTVLQNGDSVITIKSLPVKGSQHGIKAGTKVKNIKLTDGDHNIDCKIDGFGAMALKSEFVKKA
jgi:protein PhnA